MELLFHIALGNVNGNVLPWYRKLLEQDLLEDCGFQSDGTCRSYMANFKPLEFADIRKQLSSFGVDLSLSPFLQSILSRSIKWLRSIINHESPEKRYLDSVHPLVLAIGWPEGLKPLVEAGFWHPQALNIAIEFDDTESLRVLLEATEAFQFPPMYPQPLLMEPMSSITQKKFVNEFRSRWWKLARFYSENQHGCELEISRPQSGTNPNYDPDEMWRELEIGGVDTPKDLDCCGWSYHEYISDTRQLDLLFATGLRNLDGRLQEFPPLLNALQIHTVDYLGSYLIKWLLDHGADPNFPWHGRLSESIYPNLLFYVYTMFPKCRQDYQNTLDYDFSYDLTKLLDKCDPLESDDCHCFCSTNGCLPVKTFWKYCDAFCSDGACVYCQAKKPDGWTRFMDVFSTNFIPLTNLQMGTYYREACRMELFDRLNMSHTCCQYGEIDRVIDRLPITVDRESIQEEEFELSKQLDLLLEAYDTGNAVYENNLDGFWRTWWAKIDEILPPMPPEERCKKIYWNRQYNEREIMISEMGQRRLRRERECLESLGYEGWDFYDVIRRHLSEFLEPTEVFHECI